MRKYKLCLLALLLTALCAPAQNAEPVAKPLQYTFNLPTIAELPQHVRSMRYESIGCEITYLVVCDGLVSIDTDTLKITSITSKDGKDLPLTDSRGLKSWKFRGSSMTGSDRNPCITFSVFFPTEAPMEVPVVKGTLTAKVADKTEVQFLNFKTAEKGVAQKAGPFTFAIAEDDKDNADGNRRVGGGGRDDRFQMIMDGDRRLIKEITIKDGKSTIRSLAGFLNGKNTVRSTAGFPMGTNQQTLYTFFSVPTTPEFTLTVTFYTDMKDMPITLGQ